MCGCGYVLRGNSLDIAEAVTALSYSASRTIRGMRQLPRLVHVCRYVMKVLLLYLPVEQYTLKLNLMAAYLSFLIDVNFGKRSLRGFAS